MLLYRNFRTVTTKNLQCTFRPETAVAFVLITLLTLCRIFNLHDYHFADNDPCVTLQVGCWSLNGCGSTRFFLILRFGLQWLPLPPSSLLIFLLLFLPLLLIINLPRVTTNKGWHPCFDFDNYEADKYIWTFLVWTHWIRYFEFLLYFVMLFSGNMRLNTKLKLTHLQSINPNS